MTKKFHSAKAETQAKKPVKSRARIRNIKINKQKLPHNRNKTKLKTNILTKNSLNALNDIF